MFRRPNRIILSMVILSMTLAVFIHRWTVTGKMELTSKAIPVTDSYNSMEDFSHAANAREFSFETEETCDSRRLYLLKSKEFYEIPALFRETRSVQPAEFSRVCATYILRHYSDVSAVIDGKKPTVAGFSTCSKDKSTTEKTYWPPCVTEEYVNLVYNTFGDVMSCLRIPQKEYLPKFLLEGGLHINALGFQNDSGLGQLNETSVPQPESLQNIVEEINSSDDPACDRLKKPLARLNFLDLEKSSSSVACSLISMPNNPFQSLIVMAAKFKEDSARVEVYLRQKSEWKGELLDFEELIRRSGLVDLHLSNHDELVQETYDRLKEIVVMQSYHLGPGKSTALIRNYFLDHLQSATPIQKSDFNFHINYEEFRARVTAKPMPAHLSYPEYIYVHFPPGSAGSKSYLVRMAEFADELNKKLKEGTCVSDSYLAL